MKNKTTTRNDNKRKPRELSVEELAMVNGGKLSPAYCNKLLDNGFMESYNTYC